MRALLFAAALAVSALAGAPAAFGQSTAQQGDASSPLAAVAGFSGRAPVAHLSPAEAGAFSKQIERDLAAKGARLALVFRTGRPRDKLPEGISYTHGAFWAFVPITLADGRTINGYGVYNLYHGDGDSLAKDQSYLHQDFPLDFAAGSAVDDVAVIVPSPEMQRRILAIMASPTYAALHRPSYSLISNPLDLRHQNCNEFMLDVIAAAAWESSDPAQIKSNLREHFKPTKVKAGLVQRVLGPAADSRLKMDDHRRGIATATYESMAAFMQKNGLLGETYILQRAVAAAP